MDFLETFFAGADSAARFAAQRALVASPTAFLPAALIFLRLAFVGAGVDVSGCSDVPLIAAHLAF